MENQTELTVKKLKEIIENLPDDMKIAIYNSYEGYPYYEVNLDLTTKKFFKTIYDEWWPANNKDEIEDNFGKVVDDGDFLILGQNID